MRTALALLVVVSCGGGSSSEHTEHHESAPKLNAIQEECRASELMDLRQLDASLGPTCGSPTMPLSLEHFDIGTNAGAVEAYEWKLATVMMCECDGPQSCSEAEFNRRLDNVKRVTVDDQGKAESRGVSSILSGLAAHECLDAAVGAHIWQRGFACGFRAGMDSPITRARVQGFLERNGMDSRDATAILERCFELPASHAAPLRRGTGP